MRISVTQPFFWRPDLTFFFKSDQTDQSLFIPQPQPSTLVRILRANNPPVAVSGSSLAPTSLLLYTDNFLTQTTSAAPTILLHTNTQNTVRPLFYAVAFFMLIFSYRHLSSSDSVSSTTRWYGSSVLTILLSPVTVSGSSLALTSPLLYRQLSYTGRQHLRQQFFSTPTL